MNTSRSLFFSLAVRRRKEEGGRGGRGLRVSYSELAWIFLTEMILRRREESVGDEALA